MDRRPDLTDKQWLFMLVNSMGNAKATSDQLLQIAVAESLQPLMDSLPDNWTNKEQPTPNPPP